jgi:hypothetical protein
MNRRPPKTPVRKLVKYLGMGSASPTVGPVLVTATRVPGSIPDRFNTFTSSVGIEERFVITNLKREWREAAPTFADYPWVMTKKKRNAPSGDDNLIVCAVARSGFRTSCDTWAPSLERVLNDSVN